MAGKHSKNFFDIKSINFKKPKDVVVQPQKVSLTFKITALLLVFSLVISAAFVSGFFVSGNSQKNILSESAKIFRDSGAYTAIEILSDKNKDITGWLNVEGTDICYAVCQGSDDSFYIKHNQFGKKSRYGALFLSASDSFERTADDHNIVIFGNNIKDGSMFGSLKKYRNINFYKQNPCVDLYYGDAQEKYIIFAVMLISSRQNDRGSLYMPSKSHFADKADFDNWLNETRMRSIINAPVEVNFGDDMLTLVTSASDFENARLVVMAKKIDEWDASHTDVSGATVNAKTKYPEIWYTTRGLEYPY